MTGRPTHVRYVVLTTLSVAAILSYLLRVSVGTAGSTIQRDLELSDPALGFVLSGFFLGYFWCQVPAGWLGSLLGARSSLIAMGLLWALAMGMTAISHSVVPLFASCVLQGVAQAGLFSVAIMAIADWYPPSRRGFASAVVTGCMSVGAVIASGLTARMLGPFGWRVTLGSYAMAVLVWVAWVLGTFRNRPSEHSFVNSAELELIREGHPERNDQVRRVSIFTMLSCMWFSPSMWALCVQAFFRAFGYAFFITWFPAYLERGRGMKVAAAGDLTMIPLAGVVAGSLLGGMVVDMVLARTGRRWASRCGVAATSLALCGLATLAASLATQPFVAVVIISVGSFFSGLAGPATWAATIDISGRETAVGFALMNMAGNFGATVCPIVLGYLVSYLTEVRGDWNWVLYLFAGIYMAGALAWLTLDPNRPALD